MFGMDSGELLVIAVVALVVIGPKDLPRVMRVIGQWVGQARGMARHFRSGIDTMIRESELADMEKKWQADNERIMRDHPYVPSDSDWNAPVPALTGDEPGTGYDMGAEAAASAAPAPKPPQESVKARPKPPPRRGPGGLRSGAAPPIPAAPPPTAGDDG
ncbi:MAG TPA: Sec-independent protein translocase protein TatB [Allosphingosinicella sp.]|jgi:sec-independent protein translocase protein TatB